MDSEVKVSIIIPVYNVEKYLGQCLDSALSQEIDKFEVIAVNDGSTDSSLQILEQYRSIYSNLYIINQENRGMSEARNTGLLYAKGKYIYFLDSDDYIELNTIGECYEIAEKYNLDIINFDAVVFYDGDIKTNFSPNYSRKQDLDSINVKSGVQFYKEALNKDAYKSPVWLSFYNRDFLLDNDIWFYPGIIHEDELFSAKAFILARNVKYLPKVYFHRRIRENSIMTKNKTKQHILGYSTVAEELCEMLKNVECKIAIDVLQYQINHMYSLAVDLCFQLGYKTTEINEYFINLRTKILNCDELKLNKRLLLKLNYPFMYNKLKDIKILVGKIVLSYQFKSDN